VAWLKRATHASVAESIRMNDTTLLPIDSLYEQFMEALAQGRVVVTAPTGSGKSTQVPRWCQAGGAVLVVEPRRVACRSLAQRVAELEGVRLGSLVGYSVRDDHRASSSTKILFATTGVVIRLIAEQKMATFQTVILDEFHERSLDLDLLLALLLHRPPPALVVMSATLDGDRVAHHLGGVHLQGEGRPFPVEKHYLPGATVVPDVRGLEERLRAGLEKARRWPGDILVFLPGKGEIAAAAEALHRGPEAVIPLHGGLSLDEQNRAFLPHEQRKVILATNVAETSITIPGIRVVIDSGLVRRTRYHQGRGHLTLQPIAEDSTEQRAGRAGRTAPGWCLRLWSDAARLEHRTPPEIHREALAPLVLAACSCQAKVGELPFLDTPKDYACAAAVEELQALGALNDDGELTPRGRQLFGLPVDPGLARLLIEAQERDCLPDIIDIVATLGTGRPLFKGAPAVDDDDDPRGEGCDALAYVRTLRRPPRRAGPLVNRAVLVEAGHARTRLRAAFGLPARARKEAERDRRQLAEVALAADVRCVHVARHRRGRTTWSNGGTELELARESAVDPKKTEAIAVLASRALGQGQRSRLLATCAMPLELSWLVDTGLGQDRLKHTDVKDGRVVAVIERVYARRVLHVREEVPKGRLAQEAVRDLFLGGSLFASVRVQTVENLEAAGLWLRLKGAGRTDAAVTLYEPSLEELGLSPKGVPPLEAWTMERLEDLGFDDGEDLALLTAEDFLFPALPQPVRDWLDRSFPRRLCLGDATYAILYDLKQNEVTLTKTQGRRQSPPPLSYLPTLPGFRIVLRDRSRCWVLRE
jgi:ATP-dependent helicase HrpB